MHGAGNCLYQAFVRLITVLAIVRVYAREVVRRAHGFQRQFLMTAIPRDGDAGTGRERTQQ